MIKKMFFISIIIFSVYLFKVDVRAANTTNLGKVWNEYHEIYKDGKRYSYSTYIEKYMVENKLAYCLEPSIYFHGGVYQPNNNFNGFLNEEGRKTAELYAHYGYGYKDHNTNEWYVATQLLIWELRGFSVRFSSTDFSNHMNEIRNLANSHLINPKFDSNTYIIKSGETINLIDINNVIQYYDVVDSLNLDIKIENNSLIITANKNSISGSLKFVRKGTTGTSVMYTKANSQTVGAFLGVNDVSFALEMEVKIAKATISVNVVDETNNAPIANAVFEVYKNNQKIGTYTCNSSGRFNLYDEVGYSYRVVQISTANGYLIANPNYQVVALENKDENKVIELTFKNKRNLNTFGEAIEVYTNKASIGLQVYLYLLERTTSFGTNEQVAITLYYGSEVVATRNFSTSNIPRPISFIIRSNYLRANEKKSVTATMTYTAIDEEENEYVYFQQQLTTDGYTSDESFYEVNTINNNVFNYENVVMTRKESNKPMEVFKEKISFEMIEPNNRIVGWQGFLFPVKYNYYNDLLKDYHYYQAYYIMPSILVETNFLTFPNINDNQVLVQAELIDNTYHFKTVYYEKETQKVYLASNDSRITNDIFASNYWFVPFNIDLGIYEFSFIIEQIAIHQINLKVNSTLEIIMPPVTALSNNDVVIGKFTPREVNPDNPFPTGNIGLGWIIDWFNQIRRN